MTFGDALEADVDGSWRTRTDIADYFAEQARAGLVTVLGKEGRRSSQPTWRRLGSVR